MITAILSIIAGFVLLMWGAEYTVRGAVAIANKLHIPTIIVGLTIVAFGTSAPEFVVSLSAALKGAEGISLGNVIGSNIANLLLILGVTAVIYPVSCNKKIFLRDYIFLFVVTAAFIFFAWSGKFVFWHGIVLLLLLVSFVYYNYKNSKAGDVTEEALSPIARKKWLTVIEVTVLGLIAIVYGADLLVNGAVSIARFWGISEEMIGLTIIAFGTSLPELATSGMAAFRHQNGVALGNILGSNIWNIVFIMGVTSIIADVEVSKQFLRYDLWVMVGSTLLLLPLMWTQSKMSRREGLFFVCTYILYLVSQILIAKGIVVFE